MNKQQRQVWLDIAMDLMIAYYEAQRSVYDEWGGEGHPDKLIQTMCERVADALGGGMNSAAVYDSVHRRLQEHIREQA